MIKKSPRKQCEFLRRQKSCPWLSFYDLLGWCIQSIVQLTFGRKAEPLAVLFCCGCLSFPHVSPRRHTCREGDCFGFLARCVILIRQLLVICPKCCKTVQESWKLGERGPSCSDSVLFIVQSFAEDLFDSGTRNIVEVVWQTDLVIPETKFSITSILI